MCVCMAWMVASSSHKKLTFEYSRTGYAWKYGSMLSVREELGLLGAN